MNNFVDTIKIELKRKTPEELSEKICELVTDNIIKDKKIEELKEQLNDEIDDELKQSNILVKQQNEIERLKEEYVILQNASDEVEEEKDKEIERLNNIIKEVREEIKKGIFIIPKDTDKLLEILDKEKEQ